MRSDLEWVRFWLNVGEQLTDDECWVWSKSVNRGGYGLFAASIPWHHTVLAHRWAYRHEIGPIPEGLQLDHLCRNPPCVNPAHLEAVTGLENARRSTGRLYWRYCRNGHPYDDENTDRDAFGIRVCRACRRIRDHKSYERKKRIAAEARRVTGEKVLTVLGMGE